MKKTLQTSEWVLAASFIILLTSLFLISHLHEGRKKGEIEACLEKEAKTVVIQISGDVIKSGSYSAKVGERLGDIIAQSRPRRFANLKGLDLDSPVRVGMSLVIEPLQEIFITVDGIQLALPPGSRICDLKSKIQLSEDADPKFLRRRRILKDGERITIPRRNSNKD